MRMKITLPDKSIRELPKDLLDDLAKDITGLAKAAIAISATENNKIK